LPAKEFSCSGINYSVTLHADGMTIEKTGLSKSKSYELPLGRINSVIVQRKSMVPFATLTILAAIAAVVSKYNPLWFVISFSPENSSTACSVALIATALCAIPTISRAFFVNVFVSWDGRPKSFLVRFVLGSRGRWLARRFQRISAGS